ncbi:putative multidrug export ATP-binding/permease protein [Variibacter gotjawalensis]|uniref:Putative multidrug export ATP-binding/permease protein n=1 Tax=Variibacter gotjawalensis TaxID=1333996 RepID=A0A0S3PUN0_9BRAD|nr:ABC transporter ATP-binding protein [Variibacter gotjawalensis]NIK49984.1 ATP-binding cassette subfamily B protein [Variibacter gotjawalensis]RZS45983.1 ATP-binding cassette subfamily B protein [Variibacter gotjawalensis]BAT59658.1 putative multidrug export ATP-binding/permease protein [Variibacter gotjawalensis]
MSDEKTKLDATAMVPMLRRLLADYTAAYWRRYSIAFALMALAAIATAASAYLMGEIVNKSYVDRNTRAVAILAFVVASVFIAKGAATYFSSVQLARIANRIIADNQRRLFAKLLSENLHYFADRHSAEFVARLNTGAAAAANVLNMLVASVGRDFLALIALAAVMVYQDPVMSLVGFVVVPPAVIFLRKLMKRARSVALAQFSGGVRVTETLQETLRGMRIVKAFTLEDELSRRISDQIGQIENASNKLARVSNRSSPLMETLGGIAIALAILYAGYRVIEHGAAPGEFFSFVTAFLLAYEPAKRLARLNIDLNGQMAGLQMLFEVLDSKPTEPADDDRPRLILRDGRVELRKVSFAYTAAAPVLDGVSLVAEPGGTTALVGPSGGGKSTILNLILRFYEPQSGAVLIDGTDIATVSRRSLREAIGYVGQDTFLFRGTIRDNIVFGRVGASEDEIIAAAKDAFAHEFIMSFPRGYDTPVGEQGLQLSGGQRQRIAIARALLKNAKIILLDEATAALDSESEQQVQMALARLSAGRTTISIAHRLHTIMHADRICVVEGGHIVESGRHEDLLRKGGRYASFYRLQLAEPASSGAA